MTIGDMSDLTFSGSGDIRRPTCSGKRSVTPPRKGPVRNILKQEQVAKI